ncbi:hypothetical protein T484DRAFT_1862781 [Baffinella frigidus]|nr:hypothetical protein T484DRAFT_1862781 [Cryptophyta sp. CCMP2293]
MQQDTVLDGGLCRVIESGDLESAKSMLTSSEVTVNGTLFRRYQALYCAIAYDRHALIGPLVRHGDKWDITELGSWINRLCATLHRGKSDITEIGS